MCVTRIAPACTAAVLWSMLLTGRAAASCSPAAFAAAQQEVRAAPAPACGPGPLERAFQRARRKAAAVMGRMARRCARGKPANVAGARRALAKVSTKMTRPRVASVLTPACMATYETELARLAAELDAAESGTPVTTTTAPSPGGSTTTTLPPCTTVTVEVDVGDCTRVTSVPRGVVNCDQNCDTVDVTVPASRPLRLKGTPAPGDVSVTFGDDCNEDGTVPLGMAVFPDCVVSCDCSSEF
jgi:hypothetical protein